MDVEKILSRLVQIGTVTDVDIPKRRARVKFKDTGITSGWLYVVQRQGESVHIEPDGVHTHSIRDTYSGGGSASTVEAHNHNGAYITYWMPKINNTVVVLYLPVANSDGFILGGI